MIKRKICFLCHRRVSFPKLPIFSYSAEMTSQLPDIENWPWNVDQLTASVKFECLKGLCHELRGYSAITHFGAKNSLERQESRGLPAPSRFPPRLDIKFGHQADKFQFEVIVPTTSNQFENNKLSNVFSTSFLFDFGFRIQNQKVRLAW